MHECSAYLFLNENDGLFENLRQLFFWNYTLPFFRWKNLLRSYYKGAVVLRSLQESNTLSVMFDAVCLWTTPSTWSDLELLGWRVPTTSFPHVPKKSRCEDHHHSVPQSYESRTDRDLVMLSFNLLQKRIYDHGWNPRRSWIPSLAVFSLLHHELKAKQYEHTMNEEWWIH